MRLRQQMIGFDSCRREAHRRCRISLSEHHDAFPEEGFRVIGLELKRSLKSVSRVRPSPKLKVRLPHEHVDPEVRAVMRHSMMKVIQRGSRTAPAPVRWPPAPGESMASQRTAGPAFQSSVEHRPVGQQVSKLPGAWSLRVAAARAWQPSESKSRWLRPRGFHRAKTWPN